MTLVKLKVGHRSQETPLTPASYRERRAGFEARFSYRAGLQKFDDRRFLIFRGRKVTFPGKVEKPTHPVGKERHVLFRHKLPLQKKLLELRQDHFGFIGQISHIIRISLLAFITEKYDIACPHHLDF